MTDDAEELGRYLESVMREVQRRAEVVERIRREIRELESEVENARASWRFDVRTMQAQSGFKERLLRSIAGKQAELAVAVEDLTRAREREVSVREELEQLKD